MKTAELTDSQVRIAMPVLLNQLGAGESDRFIADALGVESFDGAEFDYRGSTFRRVLEFPQRGYARIAWRAV